MSDLTAAFVAAYLLNHIRVLHNPLKRSSRMQFLISLCLSAVAAASIAAPVDARRSDPVLVRAVIDGDTIDVALYGRVRLLGIDAPEIGRGFDTAAPFGREARDRLTQLVLHRWVRLEQDNGLGASGASAGQAPAMDAYNRHLAYVLTEMGEFVNATLVREGLARVSARVPLSRLGELKRAEAEAQAFRRGMWGAAPSVPMAEYTRRSDKGRRDSAAPKAKATKTKAEHAVTVRKPTAKKKSGKRKTAASS
jgi:endonuclease YncB( thermonuclease family)